LRYQAPQALRAAVGEVLGGGHGGVAILDLGCGTGLSGLPFRDLAARLDGVDLSPRMLAQAAARGIYDALTTADAVEFLAARPAGWDLIVAADMLMYLGDLGPLLAGAAGALRPGGLVAASVEQSRTGEVVLQPSRRYAHPAEHVRARAAAAGLTVRLMREFTPRWDAGRPVPGLLFVLGRAA
jgi:predicted TPR repeat methyltransferase